MPIQATEWAFFLIVTVFVTVFHNPEFYGMAKQEEQRKYVLPKLYNRKGDVTKRWYVQFQVMNVSANRLELKRIMCPEKFRTAKERTSWANDEVKNITKLLQSGFVAGVVKPVEVETNKMVITAALQNILNLSSQTLARKSVVTYQSVLNKLVEYYKEKTVPFPEEINKKDVLLFRDWLMTVQGNSTTTANNNINSLTALFTRYMERAELKENPFVLKRLREQVSERHVAFTDADKIAIEEYLQEHEPELFIFTRFLYFAFIRPGELRKMKISDISDDYSYVRVHGLISKNDKTETAPVIPAFREVLMSDFFRGANRDWYILGAGIKPSPQTLGMNTASRKHQLALKELGLDKKNYTLYSWKHAGAVNAYRSGVGIKQLQNMLRHSNVQTTDIYLKSLGLRTDPNIHNYSW